MMRQITGWMSEDHRDGDALFAKADSAVGKRDRAAARIGGGTV